jgi:hypothetical protein
MVKLIRLLGNSEQSDTEIRNTFREPIIVKPNAKVALVGVSAYITDEINNETFTILSSDNSQYFKIGAPGNAMSAVLTAGDYTAHGLIDEFTIAANYAGTATKGLGLHHQTAIISDHFELTTHKSLYQVNAFTDTTQWDYTGTPAAIAAGAITAGAGASGGVTYLQVYSDLQTSTVPMVHNRFGATLVNVSGSFICSAFDSYNDKYLFGFEVSGGTYHKVINDVHTSLATSWAANDVVVMETYAGGYHLTITSSTGTLKHQEDNLAALPRIWYGPTLYAGFKWLIQMRQSSQISECYATTVYGAGGQQATLKDVTSNNVLKFAADSGAVNKRLATYVGFGDEAGTDIVYSGNPAVLGGREPMAGLPANSGVLVVLDGLGPLQSFDGAATSRAPDNILYVLNDLTNVNSNILQIDIPAPLYLDLNNAHPINLNELRARFMPATGFKLNPTLSFSGKPSLTLLIDG